MYQMCRIILITMCGLFFYVCLLKTARTFNNDIVLKGLTPTVRGLLVHNNFWHAFHGMAFIETETTSLRKIQEKAYQSGFGSLLALYDLIPFFHFCT